jgi:leucyl-tRNA synthetase
MECLNTIRSGGRVPIRDEIAPLVVMVAPFAPHMAEELWERMGHEESVFDGANWPDFDESKAIESSIELAVQVNGKLRATVTVAKDAAEADVMAVVRAEENVVRHLEGVEERRVIYVAGRLVNFVVG